VSLQLHVSGRAAREIERVVQWWAASRPAAPGAVRKELEQALHLLLQQPGVGAIVPQASSPGVRRFHVERIRYWLYYRVVGNRFEVLSVWHGSRGKEPAL
jgi:plasmid stabilization system protein ParE